MAGLQVASLLPKATGDFHVSIQYPKIAAIYLAHQACAGSEPRDSNRSEIPVELEPR
jgi:hypothetical protein